MRLVLVQAYRFKPEEVCWTSFAQAWLQHGYRMVFWSNLEHGTLGLPFLPFVCGEREYGFYRPPTNAVRLSNNVRIQWTQRAKAVESDYGMLPFNFDAEKMIPLLDSVFRKLQPAAYLTWAGIEPHYGIARDVANSFGIPTAVIEKGLLGSTKLLDFGGMMGMCGLCQAKLEDLVAAPGWKASAERGAAFIPSWLDSFTPRSPARPTAQTGVAFPNHLGKKKLVVIGCLDFSTGISYPDEMKTVSLPGYRDGFDVARQVARQSDAVVVYKPHPNEPPKASWSECSPNLTISNENIVRAIEWADVAIGYGSTVDLMVMAMNKPLVLAGRSFLLNKGIAHEALAPEALPSMIETAFNRRDWAERRHRFEVFLGYVLDEYLFNNEPGGPARQSLEDMVAKVVQRFGLKSSQAPSHRAALTSVKAVLSTNGRQEIYWPRAVLKTKRRVFGVAGRVRTKLVGR